MANSEDPGQTAPLGASYLEEQSDLGLHCLPRPICLGGARWPGGSRGRGFEPHLGQTVLCP